MYYYIRRTSCAITVVSIIAATGLIASYFKNRYEQKGPNKILLSDNIFHSKLLERKFLKAVN
jgi:hypothetical protein